MGEADEIRPAGWKSPRGRAEYLAAYEAVMKLWPVPYESRQVETRFGSTHVVVSGGGASPGLVLLHAATGFGATQWYLNVAALSTRYRVHAVDFIGSAGKGTQTHPILTRSDCRDWLLDVFDGCLLTRPNVVGSSQGGWLALNLALLAPERVAALALLAPAASILPFRPLMWAFIKLGPTMPAWTGPPSIRGLFGDRTGVDNRIVRLLTLHLAHFRYQRRAVFPHAFTDRELSELRPPTLLLVGDQEKIYNAEAALDRARRLIPGVEAELVPNTGHLINMERPEFTCDRLLEFFAGITAGSGT